MNMKGLLVLFIVFASKYAIADTGKPLPDGDARDLIIRGSISSFEGDCPCPYSEDKERHICGDNSAYRQNPGSIKCYAGDISDRELKQFRIDNNIPEPRLPWDKEKRPGF